MSGLEPKRLLTRTLMVIFLLNKFVVRPCLLTAPWSRSRVLCQPQAPSRPQAWSKKSGTMKGHVRLSFHNLKRQVTFLFSITYAKPHALKIAVVPILRRTSWHRAVIC